MTLPALVLFAVLGLLNPFLEPGSQAAEQGERSYDRGDWDRAFDEFGRARLEDADPRLDFNLGAAAYRAGHYEEAADAFSAATPAPGLPAGRSAYNLGNARYMTGDYKSAVEAYREALRTDPTNEDARYNYELALKQLEAGAPPPQQQPDQGDSGDEDQQKQDQSQNSKSPPDTSGASDRPPEPGADDQDQQGEQTPPPQQQNEESEESQGGEAADEGQSGSEQAVPDPDRLLSAEQAKQLLNQITPEERELLEARLKAGRRRKAEKDW